jgi:hypothetical protein
VSVGLTGVSYFNDERTWVVCRPSTGSRDLEHPREVKFG